MGTSLLQGLRRELKRVADPAKAPQMQAYMKSTMAYHGVPAPKARLVFRELFRELTFADRSAWTAAVLGLWREADFREERYAAIELTGHRCARPFQTPEALELYEELITTGAWWDYVDALATHRVGALLKAHPRPLRAALLGWSRGGDLWKRRTSIICQISFKRAADLEMLEEAIEPSLGSREFFLRKAIGWALREQAKSHPEWVVSYVARRGGQLSPLSRREALRRLVAAGHAEAARISALRPAG